MSTLAHSERGRVGVSLVGVGTLLLVLSMLMLGSAPGAQATHEGGGGFPTQDCAGATSAGGYKVGWDGGSPSFDEAHGVVEGDVSWSVTPDPAHEVINPDAVGFSDPPQYFNYHYTGSDFELVSVVLKGGQVSTVITSPANPGSAHLPSNISHVTLCFSETGTPTTSPPTTSPPTTVPPTTVPPTTVPPTTVPPTTVPPTTVPPTTVPDTTTTTVEGPEEPTTTTTVDDTTTTTVAGPDEPELPETGAGHVLALMAGALGLLLLGSGSLVIASDRRRRFNA